MRQSIYLREVVPPLHQDLDDTLKSVSMGGRRENMVTYTVASAPGPEEDLLKCN